MLRKRPRFLNLGEKVELYALINPFVNHIEYVGDLLIYNWNPSMFRYKYGVHTLPLSVDQIDLGFPGICSAVLKIDEVASLSEEEAITLQLDT